MPSQNEKDKLQSETAPSQDMLDKIAAILAQVAINTELCGGKAVFKQRTYELYGDEESHFSKALKQIKEYYSIADGTKVVYPGSSTDIAVAEIFGREFVIHVDPDSGAVRSLRDSGYVAVESTIEDWKNDYPVGCMIALNSYGQPTQEMIERLITPGGFVIANNYTGWANDLEGIENLRLVGALLPSYNHPQATLRVENEIPLGVTNMRMVYTRFDRIGPTEVNATDDYDAVNAYPKFPDVLFIFRRGE